MPTLERVRSVSVDGLTRIVTVSPLRIFLVVVTGGAAAIPFAAAMDPTQPGIAALVLFFGQVLGAFLTGLRWTMNANRIQQLPETAVVSVEGRILRRIAIENRGEVLWVRRWCVGYLILKGHRPAIPIADRYMNGRPGGQSRP